MKFIRQARLASRNPDLIIKLIGATTLLAVVLSIIVFVLDNKKTDLDSSSILESQFTNYFVEKNDVWRLNEALSRIRFPISSNQFISIPLEPSFTEQAFQAYAWMTMGNQVTFNGLPSTVACIPNVDTPAQYLALVNTESIDKAQNQMFQNIDMSNNLAHWESGFFWAMIVVQIINAFLAIWLFYIDRISRNGDRDYAIGHSSFSAENGRDPGSARRPPPFDSP